MTNTDSAYTRPHPLLSSHARTTYSHRNALSLFETWRVDREGWCARTDDSLSSLAEEARVLARRGHSQQRALDESATQEGLAHAIKTTQKAGEAATASAIAPVRVSLVTLRTTPLDCRCFVFASYACLRSLQCSSAGRNVSNFRFVFDRPCCEYSVTLLWPLSENPYFNDCQTGEKISTDGISTYM